MSTRRPMERVPRPLTLDPPTGKVKIRLIGETEADVNLAAAELKLHYGKRISIRATEPGIAGAALPSWSAYGELKLEELSIPMDLRDAKLPSA